MCLCSVKVSNYHDPDHIVAALIVAVDWWSCSLLAFTESEMNGV